MKWHDFKELVDKYHFEIGNRFRFDHLCSDHDFEIVGHNAYYGLIIYKHPYYCDFKRFDDLYGVYSIESLSDDIRCGSWYKPIRIDNERNTIKD